MTGHRRTVLLVAWLAAVAILGRVVEQRLVVGSDLRLFMPAPRTPEERLVLEEIGEGPASRMLLLAIGGGSPQAAAETSRALVARLRRSGQFRLVANGAGDLDAIPASLLPYRYLLSPTLDRARFDAAYLQAQLEERTRDLASPAAGFLEPWLPHDPTLELFKLAESWQGATQPQLLYDVWFDATGRMALLVAETRAAGFDPAGQRAAAQALQRAFAAVKTQPALQLEASGPGTFSVRMQERTQRDVQWIGAIDTFGIIALLLLAYRSVPILVLGLLPLVSAAVAGLGAVSALYGEVHGITLAFGFTLIGVAQDYPIHLFSHQRPGVDPLASVRALWPTLATGVASTCIAYLAFLFSGVRGLAQLSVFTVSGLAVAGLTTRFLLPRLLPPGRRDPARSASLGRLWNAIADLPRPAWLGVVLALACAAFLGWSPRPLWENDPGELTPVPRALLERDSALRRALGAPDIRYLLVIEGRDAQVVLERAAALELPLQSLVGQGRLGGFDHAARYLPPARLQETRRAALPAPDAMRSALDSALAGTPFKPGVFAPFLADVEQARSLRPLQPADLAGTPLETRVGSLLLERHDHWTGLVTLTALRDPAALAALAARSSGVTLLDLKQATEELVARQRQRILACLAIAAVLLVLVVFVALRDASRVARVLAPMALTTLAILALLHALGIALSLFHLIALVLAAGLGLDYALFFEHAADDAAEQRRTLHAVIVCSLSTLLVFAMLAFSTLPVLRAIGLTVALGVVGNFVLALLLTRPRRRVDDR